MAKTLSPPSRAPVAYPPLFEGEQATRASILRAALGVFATRGFEAASLREITEAAQVNVAAIH